MKHAIRLFLWCGTLASAVMFLVEPSTLVAAYGGWMLLTGVFMVFAIVAQVGYAEWQIQTTIAESKRKANR